MTLGEKLAEEHILVQCKFRSTVVEFMFRLKKVNTFSNQYFLIRTSLRTEWDYIRD